MKIKTSDVREKLAYCLLSVLKPTLYKEYLKKIALHKQIDAVPRPFTRFLIQATENKPLVGVEIGYGSGLNAASLLQEMPNIKTLHCVDPCINEVYRDGEAFVYTFYENKRRSLFGEHKLNPRVVFHRVRSEDAFRSLPPVDFVYIDGLHNWKDVMRDLKGAWGIVKPYGYVGGHDIYQDDVKKAVEDFSWCIHQRAVVSFPDFWFRKLPPSVMRTGSY